MRLTLEHRAYDEIKINCTICKNTQVGSTELHKVLKANLCTEITTPEFCVDWTRNFYGQVVWQLYQAQTRSKVPLLTLHNVAYQLSKLARKEFLLVKKSFFQKVMVKETCLTNHVVLLVSNITPSMNTHSKSVIVELSDGAYSLPCFVSGDRPPDGKEERFDCDAVLLKMIHDGCLQVGDKVRCFGLYMFFIKM